MQNMGEIPLKFRGWERGRGREKVTTHNAPRATRCAALPGDELPTPGGLPGREAVAELGVPAPRLLRSSKLEARFPQSAAPFWPPHSPWPSAHFPAAGPGYLEQEGGAGITRTAVCYGDRGSLL